MRNVRIIFWQSPDVNSPDEQPAVLLCQHLTIQAACCYSRNTPLLQLHHATATACCYSCNVLMLQPHAATAASCATATTRCCYSRNVLVLQPHHAADLLCPLQQREQPFWQPLIPWGGIPQGRTWAAGTARVLDARLHRWLPASSGTALGSDCPAVGWLQTLCICGTCPAGSNAPQGVLICTAFLLYFLLWKETVCDLEAWCAGKHEHQVMDYTSDTSLLVHADVFDCPP